MDAILGIGHARCAHALAPGAVARAGSAVPSSTDCGPRGALVHDGFQPVRDDDRERWERDTS